MTSRARLLTGIGHDCMNIEKLRKHCLSFPGATEQIQWGADLVFKIGAQAATAATGPARRKQR